MNGLEVSSCLRKIASFELRPAVLSQSKADLLLETCAVTHDVAYDRVMAYQRGLVLESKKEI